MLGDMLKNFTCYDAVKSVLKIVVQEIRNNEIQPGSRGRWQALKESVCIFIVVDKRTVMKESQKFLREL
jgi:hypothetical protein